jgi:BirA family transcriptional regulator, biotin operon repressor / biotin---[acetyl-CoA-carboxylase] ligase
VPGSPYTDLSRPPLNAARLSRALVVPGGLWTRLDLRAETGSTNADAVAAGRAGEPEGLVVVADRQTAGRGRLGRTWTSPARAGLAVSVLLRPGVPAAGPADAGQAGQAGQAGREAGGVPAGRFGWLPLLAGVALVESVRQLAELDAVLKWPNDLLVGGRKCAGILAEVVPGAEPPAVVVGIGLNVTLREDELPADPHGQKATSLALAGATATDRDPLLRALLRSFAGWYERWRDAGGDPDRSGLAAEYARYCDTLARPVRVLLPDGGELTGTARELDSDGRLVVLTDAGEERAVAAGDIRHVR